MLFRCRNISETDKEGILYILQKQKNVSVWELLNIYI